MWFIGERLWVNQKAGLSPGQQEQRSCLVYVCDANLIFRFLLAVTSSRFCVFTVLSALEVSSSFHLFFSKPTFLVDSLDSHWLCLDYHTIIHLLPTTYYTVYNMHSVQIVLPGWHYICQNVYNRVHCIGCYFPYCNVFALPSNFRWWMKLPAMLNNINSINCFKKKFYS